MFMDSIANKQSKLTIVAIQLEQIMRLHKRIRNSSIITRITIERY